MQRSPFHRAWIALTVWWAIMLALTSPAGAAPAPLANLPAIRPVLDCASLAHLDLAPAVGATVTIQSARLYAATAGKPEFCGVEGTIAPHIGFAVKLPTQGWTQRYLQLGCGGLCGTISLHSDHDADCRPVTDGSTAVASTDMGHGGGMMADAQWARDPQARQDFAWRAVHLTAVASKALIARFYGQSQRYAYFSGCSDGGREALMEAQRFPDDFDGIAAGAPAMNFQVQNTFYHAWQALSNVDAQGHYILLASKLPALHAAVLAACDGLDGLVDGQITDPRACHFDPATLVCKPGQTPSDTCLTAAQAEVARKFYAGPTDAAGHHFTIGGPQYGSELAWKGVYVPDGPHGMVMSPKAAYDVIKWVAFENDPPADFKLADFRFDTATFAKLAARHPLYDATDTDLAAFRAHGGKLILYHGWSDPHISPINTIAYYEGVENKLGEAETRAFARLFVIPGLYHCGGGDGTSDFDILSPLMGWVEGAQAPDVLIAGKPAASEEPMMGPPPGGPDGLDGPDGPDGPGKRPMGPPPAGMMGPPPGIHLGPASPFEAGLMDRPRPSGAQPILRTRPIYPWPQLARYTGQGSIDDAANFVPGASSGPPYPPHVWEGSAFIAPDIAR
jgi:hypothetical protein